MRITEELLNAYCEAWEITHSSIGFDRDKARHVLAKLVPVFQEEFAIQRIVDDSLVSAWTDSRITDENLEDLVRDVLRAAGRVTL